MTNVVLRHFNLSDVFNKTVQLNNNIKKNRTERNTFSITELATGFALICFLIATWKCRFVEHILVFKIKYLVFINL